MTFSLDTDTSDADGNASVDDMIQDYQLMHLASASATVVLLLQMYGGKITLTSSSDGRDIRCFQHGNVGGVAFNVPN